MASQVSVAIERDAAIARINAVLEHLADEKGHEYAPLPTQGREQAIVVKNQLVHIANALETLIEPSKAKKSPANADRDTEDPDAAPRANTVTPKSSKGKS